MDASPFQTVHVLDTAQLAAPRMEADARQHLRRLLRRLATCRMGQLLLRVAVDHRLLIRFAEGRELLRPGGRAAGFYHAGSRTLVIDDLLDEDEQLVTLAHELQHFVDGMLGWRLNTIECEVRAQQTEAQAIRQLGLRVRSWGLLPSGQLRHPEDIADKVRTHPLYLSNDREAPRFDGRVHPLLDAHELLPPMVSTSTRATAGSMTVGAVAQAPAVLQSQPVAMVATGPVTQAADGALGSARPTGFDPAPAHVDDTSVGRFLDALDAHRLATGA